MPKLDKNMNNYSCKSWFVVWNNPESTYGEDKSPEEIVQLAITDWIRDYEDERTCAVSYEIGDTGNRHLHMVLESTKKIRFSAIKKIFPKAHLEPTRGSKKDAEDYIFKRNKFAEKNHTIVVQPVFYGEIKAKPRGGSHGQGIKRTEILQTAEAMIEAGSTPEEIMSMGGIQYRQYEQLIKKQYFAKRFKETPPYRKVTNYYHVGDSGTGKSKTYSDQCEEIGSEKIYYISEYANAGSSGGAYDNYNGEPVLFIDEYKGEYPYGTFLTLLDGYRAQVHARYTNTYALWTTVHITSIYPPEEIYELMVPPLRRGRDSYQQLLRRLDFIVYHFFGKDGELCQYTIPAKQYTDYQTLKAEALKTPEDRKVEKEMKQLGFSYIGDIKDGDDL